jgi:hypothetical protein
MQSVKFLTVALFLFAAMAPAQTAYYGFDKNGYPSDDLLSALHKTFAYTGYWLNNPPGMNSNPWAGKRSVVRGAGLGFLILFNGRLDAQLKGQDAAALGREDADSAIAAARREGFPGDAIIFLDQEEGGNLLPEQAAYVGAWIAAISHSVFRPGVYCSGVPVPSGAEKVSTAQDIHRRFPVAKLWVWNDQCPPAPGCTVPRKALDPSKNGFAPTFVWQYARSPLDPETASACRSTFAADQKCYAPGLPQSEKTHIDLDVSRSPDPSHGR